MTLRVNNLIGFGVSGGVDAPDFLTSRSWAMYVSDGTTQSISNNTTTDLNGMWTSSSKAGSNDFLPGTETNGQFIVPSGVTDIICFGVVFADINDAGNGIRLALSVGGASEIYNGQGSDDDYELTWESPLIGVSTSDVVKLTGYQASGSAKNFGNSRSYFMIVDMTGDEA